MLEGMDMLFFRSYFIFATLLLSICFNVQANTSESSCTIAVFNSKIYENLQVLNANEFNFKKIDEQVQDIQQYRELFEEYDAIIVTDKGWIWDSHSIHIDAQNELQNKLGSNENWKPFVIPFESPEMFASKLNCENLKATLKWSKMKRSYVAKALKLYLENSSPTNISLGETLIELEWSFEFEKIRKTRSSLSDLLKKYKTIVKNLKQKNLDYRNSGKFFMNWKYVLDEVYSNDKQDFDYCRNSTLIIDALIDGCTNCIGETNLFFSLFYDLGFNEPQGWTLSYELFNDHIQAVLYNKEGNKVFDLTSGVFDVPSGAIFHFKDYFYPTLIGYNMLLSADEMDYLKDSFPSPIYKPKFFCPGGMDTGYKKRIQLQSFDKISSCSKYQDTDRANEQNEEEVKDNSSRLNMYLEDVSNSSETEEKVEFEAETEAERKNSFINFILTNYTNSIESLQLIDHEKEKVKNLDIKNNKSIGEFIEWFQKDKILKELGVTNNGSPKMEKLFEYYNDNPACKILPPLVFKQSNKERFRISRYSVTARFFLPEKYYKLNPNNNPIYKRYIWLIQTLEKFLLNEIYYYNENYKELTLDEFFTRAHTDSIRLSSFISATYSYYKLFEKLNSECDPHTFSTEIDRLTISSRLSEVYNTFWSYSNLLSQNYLKFLEIYKKLSEANHSKLSLFGVSGKYTESSYILSHELQKIFIRHVGIDNGSFWKKFVDNFLFNSKFFFTAPIKEDVFGRVRPHSPILLEELLSSLKASESMELNLPIIDLPRIPADPCKNNESGYVQRGLFYIYCKPNQGHITDQVSDEDRRSWKGRESGEDDQTVSGIDDVKFNEHILLQSHQKLETSRRTKEVLLNGNPNALNIQKYVDKGIDPRLEVVINESLWINLLEIIKIVTWYNNEKYLSYQVAVHHLQRTSIENMVNQIMGNDFTNILYYHINPGYLKIMNSDKESELYPLKDMMNRIKDINMPEIIKPLINFMRNRAEKENETGIVEGFNDGFFRQASIVEILNNKKKNWTILKASANSFEIFTANDKKSRISTYEVRKNLKEDRHLCKGSNTYSILTCMSNISDHELSFYIERSFFKLLLNELIYY